MMGSKLVFKLLAELIPLKQLQIFKITFFLYNFHVENCIENTLNTSMLYYSTPFIQIGNLFF